MIKRKILSLILTVVMVLTLIPANVATQEVEVEAASSGTRVVGYFPSYRMSTLNSIDFSAMTHCILSFMTYSNGTLTPGFSAGDVQNIVSKCHANGVKAMIAIGGWNGFNASDNPFGTAEKRSSFVNQIMNYVNTYNLDGVDLDIEVTDANVWNYFDPMVSELSGRLKSQGKLLTMAVSTWFTGSIANSTYQYFDFLNLMTYDYNQSGTGDQAPWQQIYDMVGYYSARGVSNDKLVIGVPFYGYGPGGTAYTYAEMVNMNAGNAEVDYANGVYYNGRNTIRQKAEYSKSYGGTMIWEIGQDSFGTYSLLNVIKQVMATGGGTETTTQAPADGMTECTLDQNVNLGAWGYYVGSWSPATARYLGGTSLDNFTLKVTSNGGAAWGVQAFTAPISVNAGSTYNVRVTLNSSSAGATVLFKDDVTDTNLETKTLVAGDNVFTGTFTASNTAAFFFDLATIAAGTTVKVTSFTLTENKPAETNPAETTTQPSSGNTTWTAVDNSTTLSYGNANNITVVNVQSPAWAAGPGVFMYTTEGVSYVSINGTQVGTESVAIDGAGVVVYESAFKTEISTVAYHRADGSVIGSIEIKKAGATGGENPTEAPTEAPTSAADGFTTANSDWNNLNYWSVYFAPDWGGNPTGSYKDGNSYSDFAVKINTSSGAAWAVQMKTKEMSVEAGKTYNCKVNVNASMECTNPVLFKEDKSQVEFAKTLSAGSNTFEIQFTAAEAAQFVFDLGQLPAGIEFAVTSFSLEEVKTTNAKVEINGCQVSTTAEGYRIIYSISDTNNEVASVGMVYGLANSATKDEIVVGSTNSTVYNIAATDAGKMNQSFSSMANAESYAMTMKFVKTAEFFSQKIYARAYAQLSTGEYVYSDVCEYVMNDVAEYLYKNQLMNNMYGHDYLYNEILSLVNPSYQKISYKLSNILAK